MKCDADTCRRFQPVPSFVRVVAFSNRCSSHQNGFTLIEIMVALALATMMMFIAIPSIQGIRKPPLVRASEDFVKGCREARARAILTGRPMQFVIEAGSGLLRVEPATTALPAAFGTDGSGAIPALSSDPDVHETRALFSAQLPEEVAFRKLVINLRSVFDARDRSSSDAQFAIIHFYPNGTSDDLLAEMLVNHSEVFQITLDVITGQPTVIAVP